MGKSLIIKGADFSENAIVGSIEWYNEYENLVGTNTTSTSNWMGFDPQAITTLLKNKQIDVIRLYSRSDSTIKIGTKKILSGEGVTPIEAEIVVPDHEYAVTTGVNEIRLIEPITLGDNETITFIQPNGNVLTFNNETVDVGISFISKTRYPIDNPQKMIIMCGHYVYD